MVLRVLSKQRSISLYEDQEVKLSELQKNCPKKTGIVSEVIRRGVDLAIKELEGDKV